VRAVHVGDIESLSCSRERFRVCVGNHVVADAMNQEDGPRKVRNSTPVIEAITHQEGGDEVLPSDRARGQYFSKSARAG
jgi:hypothetical protein